MRKRLFLEMRVNNVKIFLNKKVKLRRAHFFNNDVRIKIFKKLISQQIKEFKKNKKNKDIFVLIEIGSLIGESIEVWGNELSKKIKIAYFYFANVFYKFSKINCIRK